MCREPRSLRRPVSASWRNENGTLGGAGLKVSDQDRFGRWQLLLARFDRDGELLELRQVTGELRSQVAGCTGADPLVDWDPIFDQPHFVDLARREFGQTADREDGLFAVLEVNEPRFGARRSARIALKGVRHRPRGDLSELIADQRTDPEPDYHRSGDRQSCGLGQPRREPA